MLTSVYEKAPLQWCQTNLEMSGRREPEPAHRAGATLICSTPGSAEWRELTPLHDALDDGPGGRFAERGSGSWEACYVARFRRQP